MLNQNQKKILHEALSLGTIDVVSAGFLQVPVEEFHVLERAGYLQQNKPGYWHLTDSGRHKIHAKM